MLFVDAAAVGDADLVLVRASDLAKRAARAICRLRDMLRLTDIRLSMLEERLRSERRVLPFQTRTLARQRNLRSLVGELESDAALHVSRICRAELIRWVAERESAVSRERAVLVKPEDLLLLGKKTDADISSRTSRRRHSETRANDSSDRPIPATPTVPSAALVAEPHRDAIPAPLPPKPKIVILAPRLFKVAKGIAPDMPDQPRLIA